MVRHFSSHEELLNHPKTLTGLTFPLYIPLSDLSTGNNTVNILATDVYGGSTEVTVHFKGGSILIENKFKL